MPPRGAGRRWSRRADAFVASLTTPRPNQWSEEPASGEGTQRRTTPLLRAASPANPNGEGRDLSAAAVAVGESRRNWWSTAAT
ncbi:hypothetical protein PAHAL_2G433800 [Panicum hallii]|uniref:Uncharacterized protein n=1 Tax=Panicum hallii TaxID=206008 RepID=A0A2T8KSJ8_9POAL|nr:hypothetical protein PAHAL_2G433800 [Panicum hallii]